MSIFAQTLTAQSSGKLLSKIPPPQPVVANFPKVEEFRLSKGLKTLCIEDPAQQRTLVYVQCAGGSAMDAVGKEGASAVLAQALAAAVQARTNAIATTALPDTQTADTNRIAVAALSGNDAFSLKVSLPYKKLQSVLDILGNVFSRPSFLAPTAASEVNAAVQHVLIANQVAEGSARAPERAITAMATRITYSFEHPYSRSASEESLRSLRQNDLQAAYSMLCMPNNTTVVIIGKATKKSLLPMLKKSFGAWKSGDAPYMTRPRPQPMEQGIYWVETARATPTLAFTFEAPPRNDMEYDATRLAANLLERRINAELSTKDSSLAATITLSDNKYANVLVCQKRLESTSGNDSASSTHAERLAAVRTLLHDAVKRCAAEAPSDAEMAASKTILLERYASSLRQPEALASLLLSADANGLSLKELQNYPKRVLALTPEAVRVAAGRLSLPEPPPVIVLGRSALLPDLQTLGKVYRYAANGEPIVMMEDAGITLDSLLALHTQALGGALAVQGVSSLTTTTETQLSVMAQKFPGTILTKQKVPNKITRKLEITATQIVQELWCDGKVAFDKIEMMGQEQPLAQRSAKETESALFDAQIFPALTMQSCGFTPELLGKRDGYYVVKASTESGTVKMLLFDGTTHLLASIEEMRQTPQGIIKSVQEFREYGIFEGIRLPTTIVLKTGPGTLIGKSTYQINLPIADEQFQAPR